MKRSGRCSELLQHESFYKYENLTSFNFFAVTKSKVCSIEMNDVFLNKQLHRNPQHILGLEDRFFLDETARAVMKAEKTSDIKKTGNQAKTCMKTLKPDSEIHTDKQIKK